ncbi:MAG: 5-formyltetrahydrofolate cyclo-ligase [Ruminococcaceae bacterium]|nr:5-formyltetrahydrofolate cyclo-ligase [Oscillospiraceae bacterium]
MTTQEQKQQLRKQLLEEATGFDAAYLAASDAAIAGLLLGLPEYRAAGTVFCYVSVRDEVDTRAFIEQALADGKRVCVPRCGANSGMDACAIAGFDELLPGRFGLPEPAGHLAALPPDDIDLVVAPCVAAGKDGSRLGRGAGFYDRYLAGVAAPVACLCRGKLLRNTLPQERFDRPVDIVVAETGVIRPAGMGLGGTL